MNDLIELPFPEMEAHIMPQHPIGCQCNTCLTPPPTNPLVENSAWTMLSGKMDELIGVNKEQNEKLDKLNERDHELDKNFIEYKAASDEKFNSIYKSFAEVKWLIWKVAAGTVVVGGGSGMGASHFIGG